MSEVNINLSVSNIPNVDRLHNETHRTPIVHVEQNAQKSTEEFSKIVEMPVEIERMEKKNVNPEDRKIEENEKRKKRQNPDNRKEKENREKRRDGGAGIDFLA
ncbi:MAG: hypothetical protein N2053_02160 [Chitinispirillaceae bacterium]|nr:hypothetical protein [Chitinispirillaceae bacterium]